MPVCRTHAILLTALAGGAGGLASFGVSESPSTAARLARQQPQSTSGVAAAGRTTNGITHFGCGDSPKFIDDLEAVGVGPTRLSSVHCLQLPRTPFTKTSPILSPDVARFFVHASKIGLHIGAFANVIAADFPLDATFADFTSRSNPSYAWSSRADFVWGVDQETAVPSGFAIGPLKAVRARTDGRLQTLPPLTHPAGTLDGLFWIGRKGLALARFGTSGGYYRPERANPDPTIAFVDASRGVVLQALSMRDVPEFRNPLAQGFSNVAISSVAGGIDPRGRAVAFLGIAGSGWLVWTRGKSPRHVGLGYDTSRALPTLTPDATRVLVSVPLQPDGVIHCRIPCRRPAPTPRTGVIAALHDIGSGKLIWSTNGTAVQSGGSPVPAISPNGRYALIGSPADARGWPSLSLISMKDGRVLQTFRGLWNSGHAVGFSIDGQTAWISGGSQVALYAIRT